MSSVGYIYTQDMNEESSATQGPFYVTNTLRIEHPSIKVRLFDNISSSNTLIDCGIFLYFLLLIHTGC